MHEWQKNESNTSRLSRRLTSRDLPVTENTSAEANPAEALFFVSVSPFHAMNPAASIMGKTMTKKEMRNRRRRRMRTTARINIRVMLRPP